ncbi:MAG: hypothetical protein B7Y99_10360 [Caulobacterales bacterium 32-69-10]|nr:MAG: hypothetical protein B7Y99_10360 [Caulobacterales bacterium 32-69-10]
MGSAATAAQSAAAGPSDAELSAEFDARVRDTPGADIMVEIARRFPGEFDDLKRRMIAGRRRGESLEDGERVGAEFMTGFFARHMPAVPKAPTAELMAMVGTSAALARTLKSEDVEACGSLVWDGGLGPGGRTDLSDRALANLGAYQRSLVAAMAAGEKTPTIHRKFDEADTGALIGALIAAGADESVLEVIDKGGEGATPEASCEAGVFLMDALSSLPPESQVAFMFAQ